jgi:hypothetical protein
MENRGGMMLTGEQKDSEKKTCSTATLSSINTTWIDQGTNPGLRGQRSVTLDKAEEFLNVNNKLSKYILNLQFQKKKYKM